MRMTDVVVIGAGHAGLAMSRCLALRGVDHVVLERGEVANSWRTERWDSLRLLTPNWQRRLPGLAYDGDDPDGFATMPEVIGLIEGYARTNSAPVRRDTAVTSVRPGDPGYLVCTTRGDWRCGAVVLATGACNVPSLPRLADGLPADLRTLTSAHYRNPDQLEPGGVLVVGASASGVQLAGEIHRSGRPVTLAVGEHVRAPRTYRGRDIQWWMDASGLLDQRYDEVDDIVRARRLPSFQLIGSAERPILDLNGLREIGVRVVGRLAGINDSKLQFSGALRNHCALADLKMGRLLDTLDRFATDTGLDDHVDAPHRFPATEIGSAPPLVLDLGRDGIRTILWATGFRPDYRWLEVPVLDRKGQLMHDGGVTPAPGLYAMGLQFLRRRKSALIDGAADDARELSNHLLQYLRAGRCMQPRQAA